MQTFMNFLRPGILTVFGSTSVKVKAVVVIMVVVVVAF